MSKNKNEVDLKQKRENFLRCSHCKDQGGMYGTILSEVVVSVIFPNTDKPAEPLAKMWRCCKCGYELKRWLVQPVRHPRLDESGDDEILSAAQRHNITGPMIAACLKRFPKSVGFTLAELRIVTPRPWDNPDRNIEPTRTEEALF